MIFTLAGLIVCAIVVLGVFLVIKVVFPISEGNMSIEKLKDVRESFPSFAQLHEKYAKDHDAKIDDFVRKLMQLSRHAMEESIAKGHKQVAFYVENEYGELSYSVKTRFEQEMANKDFKTTLEPSKDKSRKSQLRVEIDLEESNSSARERIEKENGVN